LTVDGTTPPPGGAGREFGVYLHVPFCRHRCDYCAFSTYTDRDHLMARYVDACIAEVARAREEGELVAATSLFVGGGTPSRLPAEELCRLVSVVPLVDGAEVTVECNPEDASASRFAAYRQAGVTRLSFGVQSTAAGVLASLGRRHQPESVTRALALVREAGFASFNVDLIFGAAAESDADWDRTLGDVLAAAPPHVSAYALTVEPGTPLARDTDRHPDDDVQARRYRRAERVLAAAGFRWEEVSNWALPGHGCRHNRLYWRQGDYLGFGSSAHSHRAGRRWWNVRTPDRYVAAVEAGRAPVVGEEVLSPAQRVFERLALSLRTPEGVPAEVLPDVPELDPLVVRAGDRKVLTLRGRLLANAVTSLLTVDVPTGSAPAGASPGPARTSR
jgi:putative oxygen-independent coproporphyrinogen III oxidase